MNHLRLRLTLNLSTAFHTTGNQRRLGVDKVLARSADGDLILPATSLKGFLRERAAVILRTWGHSVCLGPEPNAYTCDRANPCLVCQVFGNPRHASPLRFHDGRLAERRETDIRAGVAISRHRRAAVPQRLFFQETTLPEPTKIQAKIEGWFKSQQDAEQAAALVVLAARLGHALGGSKTRGLGWISKMQAQAEIDGQTLPEERLQDILRKWQGGHDVG